MSIHAFDPSPSTPFGTLCGLERFGLALPPPRASEVTCRACLRALDQMSAGVDDSEPEISYRSTGRGTYDVVETVGGRTVVLASVMFREGARGRVGAMEALTAFLAEVEHDEVPA